MITEENIDLQSDADKIVKESSDFLKQEEDAKSGATNNKPEEEILANSPTTTEYAETSENIQNIDQISTKKSVNNNPFPSLNSPINESLETPEVYLDKNNVQKFFEVNSDVVDAPITKMEEVSLQDHKPIDPNEHEDNSTTDQSHKASMNSKVEVDIFPDLQLESPCRSNSLSKISSTVSASKAARKLKQQRTMSKDRSEDSKH